MAIAQIGSGNAGSTAGDSHTASITVPVGTDGLIIWAWRGKTAAGTTSAPTSVTVATIAATGVAQTPTGSQNSAWGKMYFYLTPPSGSQSIVVSAGGGEANNITGFEWSAYSGFAQSSQPDSSGLLNNTTTTAGALATTVVASNCWAVIGFNNQGGTPTSYTNGTERIYAVPNAGAGIADSNTTVATGSFTITVNQSNQEINGVIASFSPAVASTAHNLSLLGVGT